MGYERKRTLKSDPRSFQSKEQEDWSYLPNKLDGERLGVEQVGQGEGKSEI